MNASVRTFPMPANLLASARQLAGWHEDQGRPGSAVAIRSLVAEVETLREAAKGSLVIINQAIADKTLAQLKASTLLLVAEKLQPVIDAGIEQRRNHSKSTLERAIAVDAATAPDLTDPPVAVAVNYLSALSDELHTAIRLARG